ncbi:MAG: UDP-N-acetylmuramoyl-L-alanyl-D-glutamate--2,6-diaminopimelate ligase [Nitrospinae bacterium]|nr:UDP-N-acetylmuramoyl-L-alanyl-D-glutamate--2,6-diaminopimelate ligase [Nitrospinota bacterium]MBF0635112.1 UDP-N-acetylmuramoyl-L-alanyl-D-glutamate--2,6-diaminopimelate ligase [Nitrospinota bacterium]
MGLGAQKVIGSASVDITGVCHDSRNVRPGFAFAAITGNDVDGHDFIAPAIKSGATLILAEDEPGQEMPENVTYVVTADSRFALGALSDYFYGFPSRGMKVVGITGTNGKTTTSYIIASALKAGGLPCGRIGTIGHNLLSGQEVQADNTTPESSDVHKMLGQMALNGAKYCAMEVSSHALEQGRVDSVRFAVGVFTNLTQDHLDYHGDMEGYFSAKARLFTSLGAKRAVINADDPYGARLLMMTPGVLATYGLSETADFRAENIRVTVEGTSMTLKTPYGAFDVRSALVGKHNVYNILAACAAVLPEGVSKEAFAGGVAALTAVPGRFERVTADGAPFAVIVDYAHTHDALENVLKTARSLLNGEGKLIALFGCGGDRDKTKRPLMGRAAWTLADRVVVTSDNPRTENPDEIIGQVLAGIERKDKPAESLAVEPDRASAIRTALKWARKGDIVMIAGKGHEDYQIVGKTKTHFDDRETARALLREIL